MNALIVVDDPEDWPAHPGGPSVVPAYGYLTDPGCGEACAGRVFNLCRSYRYQSLGYYVSLLAEARGRQAWPRVDTIEDLQSQSLAQTFTSQLAQAVEQALAGLEAAHFELSAYFGRGFADGRGGDEGFAGHCDALAQQLFVLLQAPLLRARFERAGGRWHTRSIALVGVRELPDEHRRFAVHAAASFFAERERSSHSRARGFDLAILHNPQGVNLPSDAEALRKFAAAATLLGMHPEFITPADFDRLPAFDALFIRDTTFAHHYTYRFARRARNDGLVVIDDPDSILKCNNKVFLAELLAQHWLPIPRTLLIHRGNIDRIVPLLTLPCVLKQPDSSFSSGVDKADSEPALRAVVAGFLEKSALIVAQEWLPTEFDWRIGILDRRVLFVCKYYMAHGHWQIIDHNGAHGRREGRTEALAVGEAPEAVLRIALQAANLIGDGFYGVDIKQTGQRCCIIEINDNPNVDAGHEDGVLKDALYREVMAVFRRRLERRAAEGGGA